MAEIVVREMRIAQLNASVFEALLGALDWDY